MPHRVWKHHCAMSGSQALLGVEVCTDCGCNGRRDGWHYSMIEAMGAYQQRTGLKPIGPHRALADQLLKGLFELCPTCAGRGVLDDAARWRDCPQCDGATAILIADPGALADARRKILAAFPDASVESNETDAAAPSAEHHEEVMPDEPEHPNPEGGMFLAGTDISAESIALMYWHLTGKETTAAELEEIRRMLEEDSGKENR